MTGSRPTPDTKGSLARYPLPRLLYYLFKKEFLGVFAIERPGEPAGQIYFRKGCPVLADLHSSRDVLGRVLLERGLITDEAYTRSLEVMVREQGRQGEVLLRLGAIDQRGIVEGLRLQLHRKLIRLFALRDASFSLSSQEHAEGLSGQGAEVRANPLQLIYHGVRNAYDAERMRPELEKLSGQWIGLRPRLEGLERHYGMGEEALGILGVLRHGALPLDEILRISNLGPLETQMLIYTLWVTEALITGPPGRRLTPSQQLQAVRSDLGRGTDRPSSSSEPLSGPLSTGDFPALGSQAQGTQPSPERQPLVPPASGASGGQGAVPLVFSPPEKVPLVPSPPERVPLVPSPPEKVPLVPSPPESVLVPSPPEKVPLVPSPPESVLVPSPPEKVPLVPSPPESVLVPSPPEKVPLVPSPPESVPLVFSPPSGTPTPRSVATVGAGNEGGAARSARPRPGSGPAQPAGTDQARQELAAKITGTIAHLEGQNHFEVLGVERNASLDLVREAYFKLAKLFHPDRCAAVGLEGMTSQAAEIFRRVNEAHTVLTNPESRRAYENELESGGEANDEARAALEAEFEFQKGVVFFRKKNFLEAYRCFEEACRLNGQEGEHHAWLGWTLFSDPKQDRTKILPEVKQLLQRAVALSPRNADCHYYLGEVHLAAGDEKKAQVWFEKAVGIRSEHVEASRRLRLIQMRREKDRERDRGLFGRFRKK